MVPHRSASVPLARRQARALLISAGVPLPAQDDAELVVAEILTNAIEHARPLVDSVELSLRVEPSQVTVAVTDGGSDQPLDPTRRPPSSTRGRGLSIVERLCAEWTVHEDAEGRRTVAAVVPFARP